MATQAVPSREASSAQRTWFLQGMALGALMLVAVYSAHGLTHHDGGSDDTSNHDAAFAFQPAVPGLRTRGGVLSPANFMRMNFGGSEAGLDQEVPASDPNDAEAVQQAMREVASLAKRIPGSDSSSMSLLAMTALKSGGDPHQLASVFAVMAAEDKQEVKKLQESVLEKAKSMAGSSAPWDFFDPLGFCTDDMSEGKLCFYREAEIKHGRLGMLASLGFLVGEQFHPLFGGDIDVPSYIAFQQTPLQTFWPAVVAAIAIPETFSVFEFEDPDVEKWAMKTGTGRVPGDMGFDPLRIKPTDPAQLKTMQTKEINNGRLAMLGAAGMIAQELVNGNKIMFNDR